MNADKYTLSIIGVIVIAVVCALMNQWTIVSAGIGILGGIVAPQLSSSSSDNNASTENSTEQSNNEY